MAAASAAFGETLYSDAGRYDEVIDLVRQAQAADPSNVLAFWYEAAMLTMRSSHTWDGRLSTLLNPTAETLDQLARAQQATERAAALAAEQGIEILILPTWPGLTTFVHGLARNDPEIRALGVERLRDAAERFPQLGALMFAATIGQFLDRGDPLFAEAIDIALESLAEAARTNCRETQPRICANAGAAPHGAEGALVIYGDLLAKAGQPDTAASLYALARTFGASTDWRFLSIVDERLAALDQRVALYADGDRDNDPPFGARGRFCGMCHFTP